MSLRSDGYEMEVEMIWEAVRLGMPIEWVPVRWRQRVYQNREV